jgi:hypothetical protein
MISEWIVNGYLDYLSCEKSCSRSRDVQGAALVLFEYLATLFKGSDVKKDYKILFETTFYCIRFKVNSTLKMEAKDSFETLIPTKLQ